MMRVAANTYNSVVAKSILHLLIVVSFFSVSSTHAAQFNRLIFSNLSETIELTPQGNKWQSRDGLFYVLDDALILKVDDCAQKRVIQTSSPHIESVIELYQGQTFCYLKAQLTSEKFLINELNRLERQESISLVQPDLIQARHNSSTTELQSSGVHSSDTLNWFKRITDLPTGDGHGVKVAIIDDGVALSHPAFHGVSVAFEYDVESQVLDASPKNEQDSHGTKVASAIFSQSQSYSGLAPNSNVIAIRQPHTRLSDTLIAFNTARLAGADVINCSWHTSQLFEPLKDVVDDLAQHGRDGLGVFVVFSAGNEGHRIRSDETEASIESAIVVGSRFVNGVRSHFSNYGSSVDIYLPTQPIRTAIPTGEYRAFSGTSLSAALVSGLIANLVSSDPSLTVKQVENLLTQEFARVEAP